MKIEVENTYVVGDIHARWDRLKLVMESFKEPCVILVCGDFGWWPHFHGRDLLGNGVAFDQYAIGNGDNKVFWCDGNHENHDVLRKLVNKYGRRPIEVTDNVFYCPRGSIVEINGEKFLFFGGAMSTDKHLRVEGVSWWRGEDITLEDIKAVKREKVDVVISHTCPTYFDLDVPEIHKDANKAALDYVFDCVKPHHWFFGHYHMHKWGRKRGCKWRSLDRVDGGVKSFFNYKKSKAKK